MSRYFGLLQATCMMLVGASLPVLPSSASPNYQERDGIFGEIKYAEFCNYANSVRYVVKAEAGSRTARVQQVDIKIFYRPVRGVNIGGQSLGYVHGAN